MADTSSIASAMDRLVLVKNVPHPREFGRATKWFITALSAAATFVDPIAYSILYPALPRIPIDLHTTENVANLSLTLCFIGPAIGPLYWGALSERHGRRIVYIVSLFLFSILAGLAGAATSVEGLIITRTLASFCSCAVSVAGGAVVADIWDVKERGFAMSIFYLGYFAGPALGPVFGGLIVNEWGWRAIQWFLCSYSALFFVLTLLFLPETLRHQPLVPHDIPATLPNEDDESTKESEGESVKSAHRGCMHVVKTIAGVVFGPLRAIGFLRFPVVILVVFLASISFAAVIMIATSLQEVFSRPPYDFPYLTIGLLYLPMPMGIVPGGLLGGRWADKIMHRVALSRQDAEGEQTLEYWPEDRLRENAWLSVLLLPGALVWYGWAVRYGTLWIVSMVPWFIVGFGTGLVFSLVTTILTELVPHRSATMVALYSFGRNILAAVGGSVTQPLVTLIGNGWLFTAMGALALANLAVVALLQRYGTRWRDRLDRHTGHPRRTITIAPAPEADSTDSDEDTDERLTVQATHSITRASSRAGSDLTLQTTYSANSEVGDADGDEPPEKAKSTSEEVQDTSDDSEEEATTIGTAL